MRNSGKKPADNDEVEQLLRAAQDDVLLKLSLNSHMSRAAAIDPDLDRRFEALKNPPKPAQINDPTNKVPSKPATAAASNSDGAVADDDLFARFTALKSSLPSHNNQQEVKEEEEESEDEVEKVIKWAIDAARLDPSLPSDDDDGNDDQSDDDDQSDNSNSAKKSKRK